MPFFRKKPIVVEAMQFDGDNGDAIVAWAESFRPGMVTAGVDDTVEDGSKIVLMVTNVGVMVAAPGDWVIRGGDDRVFPCRRDVFFSIFEPADEDRPSRRSDPRTDD